MATDDFFRARLETMVDPRHPLVVLAQRMPWAQIEAAVAPLLAHKDRAGRKVEGADVFGATVAVAGSGVSNAGRPRLPVRRWSRCCISSTRSTRATSRWSSDGART